MSRLVWQARLLNTVNETHEVGVGLTVTYGVNNQEHQRIERMIHNIKRLTVFQNILVTFSFCFQVIDKWSGRSFKYTLSSALPQRDMHRAASAVRATEVNRQGCAGRGSALSPPPHRTLPQRLQRVLPELTLLARALSRSDWGVSFLSMSRWKCTKF